MQPPSFDPETLKLVLESLPTPEALNDHPWVEWVVPEYLKKHPERGALPAGVALGWALADLWKERFFPGRMVPAYRADWRTYFALEVGYFYPFRQGIPFPKTLARMSQLLSDDRHLALLAAGGDEARARECLGDRHADFWRSIAPDAAAQPVPESTVVSRRAVALKHLSAELKRRFAPVAGPAAGSVAPPQPEPEKPPAPPPDAQDVLHRFHSLTLPPEPVFVPPEWTPLFERAHAAERLFLTAPVGTGKTYFLAALAHWLRARGEMVLLLNLREYRRVARDMPPLRFAAEEGRFGRAVLDEATRRRLQADLAAAEDGGRLWMLADEADELTEAESASVAAWLSEHRHIVLAERAPTVQPAIGQGECVVLPNPSTAAVNTFIAFAALGPSKRLARVDDLWSERESAAATLPPLTWLDLAAKAWTGDPVGYHPAAVTADWLRRLLLRARPTSDGVLSMTEMCHAFLEELAACHLGLWDFGRPAGLGREAAGRAARQVGAGEQGAVLLEQACRAGILVAVDRDQWAFSHQTAELYFAAEYAGRHASAWAALFPKYRSLLNWAAALLARRGDEAATGAFLSGIAGMAEDRLGLRWLTLADLIGEFDAYPSAAVQGLRPMVESGLRELTRIESGRLRDAVRRAAVRLGWGAEFPADTIPLEEFETDLTPWRTDLPALLSELGHGGAVKDLPKALEDRRVVSTLMHAGLRHADADVAIRSAAWLHQSPLGQVLEARVFPPTLRLAVDVVAAAAVDRGLPASNRRAAWSALRRPDLLPDLADFGEAYRPQVYTLLLGLRVGLVQMSEGKWHVLE